MRAWYLAVAAATALAIAGCGKSHRTAGSGPPQVGEAAPEIAGVDLDGHPFKMSDYRGKVVMLDFWKVN